MIAKWLPWKWLVKRTALWHGVVDPFTVLARLRNFSEPSEFEAPLELIRAGTVFQARGIINARAIQHNLDWIWPYWVERQFNPRDSSFVPRAFSLAHINLTHRNWTAVSVPDAALYALVDPRGLVTPLHDGWSLDAWIIAGPQRLVPSRCKEARQAMLNSGRLAIETVTEESGLKLTTRAEMIRNEKGQPVLELAAEAQGNAPGMLCIALRPYNPEGIQFVDSVELMEETPGWRVNGNTRVLLDRGPARYVASTYKAGDTFNRLEDGSAGQKEKCPVGMATAAALFPLDQSGLCRVSVRVPLEEEHPAVLPSHTHRHRPPTSWEALDSACPILTIPDKQLTGLYHAAARTLLSLSAGEVYPGSYTYRRFWFRDACIMLNALLALNQEEPCRRSFEDSFLHRQTVRGFFQSQQGEWDSNGQVLWLAGRYTSMSRNPLSPRVLKALRKGAEWLCRKRLPHRPDQTHPGLLPAGFSAEHLGPNNFYYWDNFWGVAGLQAAGDLFHKAGDINYAQQLKIIAYEYAHDIQTSLEGIQEGDGAIPAAPGRRMDAGAIGSIVADYPLQLYKPKDSRIMKTVEFLLGHCMIDHGFFHDMTHSGINPYLTLHLAQVLLRAGDNRYIPLVRRIAELASPTGQWPEAIHPGTGGGCMGDGQHGWAAAEWVLMIRSLFVREEADRLILGSGLLPDWLDSGQTLRFGPTATRFGTVTVQVETGVKPFRVTVEGSWHEQPPELRAAVPKHSDARVSMGASNQIPHLRRHPERMQKQDGNQS